LSLKITLQIPVAQVTVSTDTLLRYNNKASQKTCHDLVSCHVPASLHVTRTC